MSKIAQSKQEFCVLPGQRMIRCSTTLGGLTCLIGTTPRHIPEIFVKDALSKGAVTKEQLERIKAGADNDDDPYDAGSDITIDTTPHAVPGMSTNDRFDNIVKALKSIIDAGKVEDFTQQGIPKVDALSAACGFEITSSERDAALAELRK